MAIRNIVLAAAAGAAGLAASAGYAAEITLNGASCFPIGSVVSKPFEAVVRDINAAGKGVVQVKLIGGAPAIGSPFTMVRKLSRGIYDIVGCPDAYYGNVLPEAKAFKLTQYSLAEMRTNGGLALYDKLLARKNAKLLFAHVNMGPFFLWLNVKIDKPDLSGLHLRVSPVYTPFFKALGATVQRSNIAQVYTYMENGTVKGYGWPALGWPPAWIKVTKYRVEPGFYSAFIHTLFNLKKWNTLTPAQRDVIMQVGMKHERSADAWRKRLAKQNASTAAKGLQAIALKGADRNKWLAVADQAAWAEVIKLSPEDGPKLRKLFTK